MAANNARLVAVKLSRNFGHDPALFTGMRLAQADAVITMDADGQHPFSTLKEMVEIWRRTSCNIVHGVKRRRNDQHRSHQLFAGLFGRLLSSALHQDLTNATEFKLLDRRAVEALLACGDRDVFYRALAAWIGFKQETVEFDVAPSMRGYSTWNFSRLVRFATNGLVTFSDLPIRLILWLGAIAIVLSAFLGLKVLAAYLFSEVEQGYSTLLIVMLLNLGFVMVGLGVIGLYVRTTMLQVLGRPRAIVEALRAQGLRGDELTVEK